MTEEEKFVLTKVTEKVGVEVLKNEITNSNLNNNAKNTLTTIINAIALGKDIYDVIKIVKK